MGERRESRLRTTLIAGGLATGLAALSPEAAAQSPATESHVGDLMRARDPQMGTEGLTGMDFGRDSAFDERQYRLDFEREFEENAGRSVQLWLRRRMGVRLPGRLSFDDNVRGEGGRVVLTLPIEPPEP